MTTRHMLISTIVIAGVAGCAAVCAAADSASAATHIDLISMRVVFIIVQLIIRVDVDDRGVERSGACSR